MLAPVSSVVLVVVAFDADPKSFRSLRLLTQGGIRRPLPALDQKRRDLMADVPTLTSDQWRKQIAGAYESKPEYLIPILQYIQEDAGYLPPESMLGTARHLRIPESKV